VREIERITSRDEYSAFILKRLGEHVETSHVLVTQWDGYVVHPEVWHDDFLEADYIGAVWPAATDGMRVGNGGFSLRSQRLLEALREYQFPILANEDETICTIHRRVLEQNFGIRFAPEDVADRFSFERNRQLVKEGIPTFGFHGLFNFHFVEPQEEVAAFAEQMPDDLLRHEFCEILLFNCAKAKLWDAAIALGSRMLEVDPDNAKVAEVVTVGWTLRSAERLDNAPRKPSIATRLLSRLLARR
jgi:hypothetical protein